MNEIQKFNLWLSENHPGFAIPETIVNQYSESMEDPYKDLYEAIKQGKTIQLYSRVSKKWVNMGRAPRFIFQPSRYRIKHEPPQPSQNWADRNCDCTGNTISDADPGL